MKSIKPRIKILLVDDHPFVRSGIILGLNAEEKKIEFDIEEAGSGKEAIGKIRENIFDVVIMDYSMPKMNGAEATSSILKIQPEIKVLALSNYDETSCIVDMLNAGAKGYMLKCTNGIELSLAIETILKGQSYFSESLSNKLIDIDFLHKERKKIFTTANRTTKGLKAVEENFKINYFSLTIAENKSKLIVNQANVLFVTTDETDPRNKKVYLKNKTHVTAMNYSLAKLLKLAPVLIQVNKSELVSMQAVEDISHDVITLKILNEFNKAKQITLSRFYKENFEKHFH